MENFRLNRADARGGRIFKICEARHEFAHLAFHSIDGTHERPFAGALGLRTFGMIPQSPHKIASARTENGGLRCAPFAAENEARPTEVAGK